MEPQPELYRKIKGEDGLPYLVPISVEAARRLLGVEAGG